MGIAHSGVLRVPGHFNRAAASESDISLVYMRSCVRACVRRACVRCRVGAASVRLLCAISATSLYLHGGKKNADGVPLIQARA